MATTAKATTMAMVITADDTDRTVRESASPSELHGPAPVIGEYADADVLTVGGDQHAHVVAEPWEAPEPIASSIASTRTGSPASS